MFFEVTRKPRRHQKGLANNDTAANRNRLIGFHGESTMTILSGKIKGERKAFGGPVCGKDEMFEAETRPDHLEFTGNGAYAASLFYLN